MATQRNNTAAVTTRKRSAQSKGQAKSSRPARPAVPLSQRVFSGLRALLHAMLSGRSGLLLLLVLVAGSVYMAGPTVSQQLTPVERLKLAAKQPNGLSGLQQLTEAQVQQAVSPYTQHGVLAADVTAAQAALKQLPWVASANVRRELPDTLVIELVEALPVARWQQQAQVTLLLADGQQVVPTSMATWSELPEVLGEGVDGTVVVEELTALQQLLQYQQLTVAQYAVASYGGRSLKVAGQDGQLGPRITLWRKQGLAGLQWFMSQALPALATERGQANDLQATMLALASVDLRYENGFTVRWLTNQSRPAGRT